MYDAEANLVEQTFKPMVELSEKQVGIYEFIDLPHSDSYMYVFRMRVLIEEPFNEGDYMTLFDYLEEFFEEHFCEEDE
jgi:hypothetical protein